MESSTAATRYAEVLGNDQSYEDNRTKEAGQSVGPASPDRDEGVTKNALGRTGQVVDSVARVGCRDSSIV